MNQNFRTLSEKKQVDLIPYIENWMSKNQGSSIFVGCDSQSFQELTHYACVIVMHNPKGGGHILYSKKSVPKIKDRFIKLWEEVEFSLRVAQELSSFGINTTYIDLDLNPDPRWESNTVLRSALGLVESCGYKARCKPYGIAATYCADKICKSSRGLKRKRIS
jgi:predicted RNase H-related nuclease YkuK (DUF458 family)